MKYLISFSFLLIVKAYCFAQSVEFDKKTVADRKKLAQVKQDLKDIDALVEMQRY